MNSWLISAFGGAVGLLWVDTNTVTSILHARRTISTAAVVALVLAFMFLLATTPAMAQEAPDADSVIYDDVTGPYRVKVTQSPARAIVGTIQLVVEPVIAETGEPVENALVRIFGTPEEEGERQYSPGLRVPSDHTRYIGNLELEDAGVWTIDVEIDASQGMGLAIAQTTIHERARSGSNTLVGTALFVLVSAGFVGAGTWLWYTSRKARQRRNAIRESGRSPRRSSG